MGPGRWIIPGIVKDGVAVPQDEISLPDGIRVEILVRRAEIASELESELDQWDKASDEAWAMIDQWETEVT